MTEEQAGELIELLAEITSANASSGFPLTEIIAGAAGTVAILAFGWSVYTYRSQQQDSLSRRKEERTLDFINEFFSRDFTTHRSANWKTKEKVANGNVTMASVANGFIVGVQDASFEGEILDGLSEHNHLGMLLFFLQRLSFALSSDLVDQDALKATLGYQLRWHSEFLDDLIEECRDICRQKQIEEPAFCLTVDKVLRKLSDADPRR